MYLLKLNISIVNLVQNLKNCFIYPFLNVFFLVITNRKITMSFRSRFLLQIISINNLKITDPDSQLQFTSGIVFGEQVGDEGRAESVSHLLKR